MLSYKASVASARLSVAADRQITLDALRGYLNCPYLARLLLAGQTGIKSGYETAISELERAVGLTVVDRLRRHHGDQNIVAGVALDFDTLSIRFDGLKRVDGRSRLGDFHYVPVMFCGTSHIHESERRLLEVMGLFLSRIQGIAPGSGTIYHGPHCSATTVRFTNLRAAHELVEEVTRIQRGDAIPELLLNPHCPACEFRFQCHTEAVEQDSISLLRALRKKELKRFGRKGLFTLTQLAHTFRPRRKGKRSNRRSNHRYHALQALAIRDKRVYVLGAREVPDRAVRIYLDVEGNPDEGFVYLVGMIVNDTHGETRYSFWADTKEQEGEIFEQLVAVVSRYENPLVFCYGGYERTFVQRMPYAG